ncbi:MAG: ComF family protein [Clostridia bacterium]|nr:ComF family protein [Clostridia bacterium]
MKLREIFQKIRKNLLTRGYTCDCCGRELFDYPEHRFCVPCEEKLPTIQNPCPKCGRDKTAEGVCLTCKSNMPKFTQGVAAFSYKGEAGSVINRMKNGNRRLAAYLGERMAERTLPYLQEGEELLLIPVPLTAQRKKERGYNQAELLAESMQAYFQGIGREVELDFAVLEKRRETEAQKQKTAKERIENVKGAYHVHKRKACEGKTVLLIDDVLTTGATGSECARLLLSAKAKRVLFIVAGARDEKR